MLEHRKKTLLQKTLKLIYQLYAKITWAIFDAVFHLLLRPPPPPKKIRSVLHISYISHKPHMLSRAMKNYGLRSAYLALCAESNYLKMGKKGYDWNLPGQNVIERKILRPWRIFYLFVRYLRHFDVIHYHFASLLDEKGREIPYLKQLGKVIVFHFRGCDLRQRSLNMRQNPYLNCCMHCDYPLGSCETPRQYLRIHLAQQYANCLFVTTPDLLDFLPQAEHIPFIAPVGVEWEKIQPMPKRKNTFRIVSSTNHPGIDGIHYIRQAIQKLQKENPSIEWIVLQKVPFDQTLRWYKSADLYVGKLLMGYYNNAHIECMALGVPTMGYIRKEFQTPDCPVIPITPKTLYKELKNYLSQPQTLANIAQQGPAFVHRHHHPTKVVKRLLEKYSQALSSPF
ncbi:MAG: glycosyltransferase family 1 protein [Planctomycetota bacterium]|nr:MAG: glycosyltransferase family 1 protein [Planctomycetota bacterium]